MVIQICTQDNCKITLNSFLVAEAVHSENVIDIHRQLIE